MLDPRVPSKGPVRMLIGVAALGAVCVFVTLLTKHRFPVNQIVGYTGFLICLAAWFAAAIAIAIKDRKFEHDDHAQVSPLRRAAYASPVASKSRRK